MCVPVQSALGCISFSGYTFSLQRYMMSPLHTEGRGGGVQYTRVFIILPRAALSASPLPQSSFVTPPHHHLFRFSSAPPGLSVAFNKIRRSVVVAMVLLWHSVRPSEVALGNKHNTVLISALRWLFCQAPFCRSTQNLNVHVQ